jgi:hypothetical protein
MVALLTKLGVFWSWIVQKLSANQLIQDKLSGSQLYFLEWQSEWFKDWSFTMKIQYKKVFFVSKSLKKIQFRLLFSLIKYVLFSSVCYQLRCVALDLPYPCRGNDSLALQHATWPSYLSPPSWTQGQTPKSSLCSELNAAAVPPLPVRAATDRRLHCRANVHPHGTVLVFSAISLGAVWFGRQHHWFGPPMLHSGDLRLLDLLFRGAIFSAAGSIQWWFSASTLPYLTSGPMLIGFSRWAPTPLAEYLFTLLACSSTRGLLSVQVLAVAFAVGMLQAVDA